jgi:predicted RNA binding protein YcfA (HicA-like mRNA interferase family)
VGLVDSKRARRLFERVVATKNNCDFGDLRALLECLGFSVRQPGRGGSHYIFKLETVTITVPKAKPVKRRYVESILELIDES